VAGAQRSARKALHNQRAATGLALLERGRLERCPLAGPAPDLEVALYRGQHQRGDELHAARQVARAGRHAAQAGLDCFVVDGDLCAGHGLRLARLAWDFLKWWGLWTVLLG